MMKKLIYATTGWVILGGIGIGICYFKKYLENKKSKYSDFAK